MNDFKNREGYTDYVPHKALQLVNPGEVWENDNGDTVLVLGVRANVCTLLRLSEAGTHEHIDTKVHDNMYANVAMLQFAFNNHITAFKYKLKDDEFKAVKEALAGYLGLTVEVPKKNEIRDEDPFITHQDLTALIGRDRVEEYYRVRAMDELLIGNRTAAAEFLDAVR